MLYQWPPLKEGLPKSELSHSGEESKRWKENPYALLEPWTLQLHELIMCMDFRSFYLHYECGIYMYKCSEILEIEKDYQETLLECQLEDLRALREYPIRHKIDGALLRLIAPLM